MPSPIERTLDVLARNQSDVASSVLLYALDRKDEFGVEAALAIGRHGGARMKFEVIRRVDQLSTQQKDALHAKARAFSDAVEHGLSAFDPEQRQQALKWVAAIDDFANFNKILDRLPTTEEDELPAVTATLESLTDRMFDHIEGRDASDGDGYSLRNASELRSQMFDGIIRAIDDIENQPCPERLLEWGLILADAEGGAVTKLFSKLRDSETQKVHDTLRTSVHPGILRLPLDLMKRTYPFDIAFDVIRERADEPFVHHLLRTFPEKPTPNQLQNLALIESLPWLTGETAEIEAIPTELHPGLTRVLGTVGLPQDVKQNILRWLLNNGDCQTREAASSQFDLLDKSESHDILREGLDHKDVDVQVWATSHLRGQDVPDAFALLIARLDSEIIEVRDTARKELSDLNLQRAIDMLDSAPDRVTPAFGVLLKKVNPDLHLDARRELAHAIRGHRVSAIRVVTALGMLEEVVSGVATLVDDNDMLVRRTAVEALGKAVSKDSVMALQKAFNDRSPRVREAAARAMQELRQTAALQAAEEAARAEEAESNEADENGDTVAVDEGATAGAGAEGDR